jgi:hypothetical protein
MGSEMLQVVGVAVSGKKVSLVENKELEGASDGSGLEELVTEAEGHACWGGDKDVGGSASSGLEGVGGGTSGRKGGRAEIAASVGAEGGGFRADLGGELTGGHKHESVGGRKTGGRGGVCLAQEGVHQRKEVCGRLAGASAGEGDDVAACE